MKEETNTSKDVQTIKLEPALELLNHLQKALMLVWQEAANGKFVTTTVDLRGKSKDELTCRFIIGAQVLEAKK